MEGDSDGAGEGSLGSKGGKGGNSLSMAMCIKSCLWMRVAVEI